MKKAISFILVFVLVFAALPITPAYASLPRSLDKSRLYRLIGQGVLLTIGDMTFQGNLSNESITDEDLERLFREALANMNLTEADFEMMNILVNTMKQYETMTKEEKQRMLDRWVDMLGIIPVVGDVATIVNIWQKYIINEDFQGGYKDSIKELNDKAGEKFLGLVGEAIGDHPDVVSVIGSSGEAGKAVGGKALPVYKAVKACLEGMIEARDRTNAKWKAKVNGKPAARMLDKFYNELNSLIEKENLKYGGYSIEFANVKAQRPVTVFGAQCTETWTLFMVMSQETSDVLIKSQGRYEGVYTIDIEYNLGAFGDNLTDLVQLPEWRGKNVEGQLIFALFGDQFFQNMNYTLTDPGTWKTSRRLEGKAIAEIYPLSDSTITPKQESDKNDVEIKDVKVRASGFYGPVYQDKQGQQTYYDIKIVADGEALYAYYGNKDGDGYFGEYPEALRIKIPWGDNRGDEAEKGWKISLSPIGR